ncbi:phage tail tape measure protein [Mammaliicoccus sciuri]|uniref:phage tail tape measure protein n=1 Tax=Mammaliicoccus sciuri TaxID=1296 RepID=UPI0019D34410|nr:phage tail tape measure protein [Mammaliicoccus sciuri]QSN68396.1 phage tail tape measure protein [Mammaliicoccus sciuri]UIU23134.1 phage tail tape measure protein [Mammaliicoccus sciuri]UIU26039.1 phage tail tape measure protein [Mammaliicoccus sciuri]
MADFNIGILSTLDVDTGSSKKKVNETIKEIEKSINSIQAELEVKDTNSSQSSARKSANAVIDNINKSGGLKKINVEFDINQTNSKKNIQKALASISNEFSNKKIQVGIQATTDTKSLNQAKNTVKNSTPLTIDESPQGASTVKQVENAYLNLGKTYKNIDDLRKALDANTVSGLRHQTKEITDANGALKAYQVTLSRINEKGKNLGSQTFNYNQNANGLALQTLKQINNEDKARKVTHDQINESIQREISNINRLNQQGKISSQQASELRAKYEAINSVQAKNGALLNSGHFDATHRAAQQQLNDYTNQNKLLRQRDALLSQIERSERRLADSINKRQTGALKQELMGSNFLNTKDAAYRMNQIQSQVRGITAEAERATRSQLGFVESFRQAMIKFPVWMGASTLFFGAIQSGKMFVETIVDIDSKMVTLQKVMAEGTDMATVFKNANDAALQFGQTIGDALDVYAEFARQGVSEKELPQFANAALIAANVGEINAKQASEYLTSMSAQWETGANDAMRQVDSLNEISNNYATTVEKLAQGQTKAGSTAKAMGLDFNETNAVIGTLTAKTKQSGDEIGNFMKAVLPKLYTDKSKGIFESLGVSMTGENGELKSAIQLLQDASLKVKELDKDQQASVIRGLGGVYHYQRLQVLMDDLAKVNSQYEQIKNTSENSGGSALKENAVYMQSIEAKINKAKVAMEQFALALGDAFLESGMLDGIRMFTQLLTGLTAGITNLGSAAPLFGLLGGAVSLFSNNVRSGFDGARKSLADFIVEANNLSVVRNNLGEVQSFGASSQLQFDKNGNYDKNASQAKAASTANYALSKAQRDVSITALASSGALNRNTASTTASALASKAATAAANTFKGALRGLMAATGVGLALTAVSFALEKIVGHFDKASQSAEQFDQAQQSLKQGMQSQGSDHIEKLITSYDELESKLNSGTGLDNTEVEKYKTTTQELANLFPDLVAGESSMGTKIAGNSALLQSRVEIMKTQLELEKQIAAQKNKEEQAQLNKEADKSANWSKGQIQGAKDTVSSNFLNMARKGSNNAETQKELENIDKLINKTKDLTGATEARKQAEKALADLPKNASNADLQALQQRVNVTRQLESDLSNTQSKMLAANSGNAQQFMTDINTVISKNQQLGTVTQSVFNNMSMSIARTSTSTDQAKNSYTSLLNEFKKDTGFQNKMATYEQAVQKFKNAAKNNDDVTGATKEVEAAYKSMSAEMVKAMEASGNFDASQIKAFKAELKSSKNEVLGVGDASKNASSDIDKLAASQEDAAEAASKQAEANKEVAESLRGAISNTELLTKAQEEMANGEITPDTIVDLFEAYGDEALIAAQNGGDMHDFLMQKQEEEKNNFNRTLQEKLNTSAAFYQAVAGQGTELAEHLANTYGIDASNYGTITELKAGVTDTYNNGTKKQQETLVDGLAKTYGVDISNFDTLGQKKQAIENKLMQLLGQKWADYINQIADSTNNLFSSLGDGSEAQKMTSSALSLAAPSAFNITAGAVNTMVDTGVQSLLDADPVFKQATGSMGDLSSVADQLGESLDGLGSPSGSGGKAAKGAGDTGKAADKAAKNAEKLKKEAESAGVTVEKLYKTFQKQTYVADELSMALDRVNHQLEMQQLNTQKYATWSQKYRDSLRQENKLIDEKTKKLNEQIKSMEAQIAAGKVIEYGLVSSDVNVPYYKYTANNMSGGQTGSISSLSGSSTQAKVWNNLKARGLSDAQVAGIMGNIERESGFKTNAKEVGGTGIGLVQWSFARANNLKAYAKSRGKAWTDLQTQLDFLWHELNTSEISALNALKKATTATSASNIFQQKFERAGVVAQGQRNAAAKKYYNQFKGMSGSGGIVQGTAGSSVVNDNNTWMFDKQFGRYNNGGTHYGRDITGANINGKAVKAARAGVVTFSGWGAGGNMLSVFDGQNTYTYMHLLKPATVKKGQTVKAGQVVGQVGSTFGKGGMSSGPHLHVQVNKGQTPNGTYVNSFSGKNAAIDAQKAGYLKVAGSSGSSIAGLMSSAPVSGAVSADYVNDLNAAEEARLAQIEAIINEENAAEAMKQKVDELRKSLMDKQLEQARNSQQKNENLYNIYKSHTEEYDHWKELQQAKSAKLEYELNKIEFEKGRNNQTWRDKNAQLQASRNEEKAFEQGKINYINKAMKQDKKLFGKDTVYRDEFEQMKRAAQQSIRDIASGIQQANGEIAASIIDQILDDYDKAEKKLQAKIDSLSKKKQFLDSEDNKQAKTNVKYTKQQADASTDLGLQIKFTISELERQNKYLKGNYELQKRVKDRILELKSAYDDARLAAHQYRIEAADADIERQLNVNSKRLKTSQKSSLKADYESSFISQEYQIDLWRDNQADKLKGLNKERTALNQNKKELEAQLKLYKDMPTQAKKIKDAIEEITNSVQENSKAVHQIRLDLSQSIINSIKTIYQKQLEMATKAYDDEYKEYEKLINKKLKLIDEEAQEETYNKDITDKTEALNKLRDEIAQRMGDDSLANQKKLKELREQLKDAEYEYDAYIRNKEREDRKKALQEELEDKGEQIEKQKEDMNKAYTDLLEDTRKFNELQEQIMEGQVEKYKSLITDLTKYVNDNMKDIGKSVSQNMLDALNETFGTLEELTSELKKYEKGDNKVPNSTLKPKVKSEVSQAAIKAVNALSYNTTMEGLSINNPTLPKSATTKTVTNNNNTQMEALVNIQNFTGTQKEVDNLADMLATEARKRGLLI